MLDFVIQSKAPIVFGENVTIIAIDKAVEDLKKLGLAVKSGNIPVNWKFVHPSVLLALCQDLLTEFINLNARATMMP